MKVNLFGYWGMYHRFDEDGPFEMIWIGPMSYDEIDDYFCQFRHNFRDKPPPMQRKKSAEMGL